MKRLLVSLDEERYEDLRRLAFEKKASMADLVRYAMEQVFEDELDAAAAQRGMERYLNDPSDYVSIEDLMEQMGIERPHRRQPRSRARAQKAAS